MSLLGAYYKVTMIDVVVYISSVLNPNKHTRKVACLENFAEGRECRSFAGNLDASGGHDLQRDGGRQNACHNHRDLCHRHNYYVSDGHHLNPSRLCVWYHVTCVSDLNAGNAGGR